MIIALNSPKTVHLLRANLGAASKYIPYLVWTSLPNQISKHDLRQSLLYLEPPRPFPHSYNILGTHSKLHVTTKTAHTDTCVTDTHSCPILFTTNTFSAFYQIFLCPEINKKTIDKFWCCLSDRIFKHSWEYKAIKPETVFEISHFEWRDSTILSQISL